MTSIEVKDLRKVYRLYQSPAYRLKEIILRRPFHTEFVALNAITFSVGRGETFGIIGENGAGKSTLLKVLARTLKPTSGEVQIHGRTAALLELGTGFNPELSGEENIYLNAYLMGLSKGEIDQKKQEIIAFSELGDFIRRPVKTYSSGMTVRLAFSIATSVDPEVLIIDEALSVGDQHFQKKSIDRMMQFKDKGKTIFFCSHALYFVQELCNRSLWLRNGKIEEIGETSKVINAYSDWVREKDAGMNVAAGGIETRHEREVESPLWIDWVKVTDAQGHEAEVIKSGQDIHVRLRMRTKDPSVRRQGHIGISITRNDEETVYGFTTKMDGLPPLWLYEGQEVCARFPSFPLLAGQYYFLLVLADEHALHPYDIYRTEMFSVENLHGDLGMTRLNHSWDLGS